jgi:4-hydroxy-tetrahydrodipicolinate reductase
VVEAEGVSRSLTKKVDAVVDFSTPEAALERLSECVKAKTAAVICTTGFTDAQKAQITSASKKIPVIYSSNMSVGVNLLFKRVPEIAKTLGETYDIDIVETHHRFKKDAPSGTAKTLAERIESATGRKPNVHAVRSRSSTGPAPATSSPRGLLKPPSGPPKQSLGCTPCSTSSPEPVHRLRSL